MQKSNVLVRTVCKSRSEDPGLSPNQHLCVPFCFQWDKTTTSPSFSELKWSPHRYLPWATPCSGCWFTGIRPFQKEQCFALMLAWKEPTFSTTLERALQRRFLTLKKSLPCWSIMSLSFWDHSFANFRYMEVSARTSLNLYLSTGPIKSLSLFYTGKLKGN